MLYADGGDVLVAAPARRGSTRSPGGRRTPRDLVDAVRAAGRGERALPEPTAGQQRRAAAGLGHVDRAIVAMRLAGTASQDIAMTVGLSPAQYAGRQTETS